MQIIKKPYSDVLVIFYIAIGFLWMDGFYAFQRFGAIGTNVQGNFGVAEYVRQIVFVVEYILAVVSIFIASGLRKPWGLLFLVLIWLLVTVDLVAHSVYGRPADLANIAVLNASVANISDAIQKYSSLVWLSIFKTSVIFIPLILKNILSINLRRAREILLVILAIVMIYGVILIKRGPPALIGFPKGFSYGLGSVALQLNDFTSKPNKIATVQSSGNIADAEGLKNIIVMVDESVEYSVFNSQFSSTKKSVINYGRGYSGGNCSASSNYIIRKGYWERSDDNVVDIKEVDSLFKIAKRRGYVTTYIDNQQVLKDPTTRNYISDDELRSIDHVVENQQSQYMRDTVAYSQILNIIKSGKNFIFINKNGAHFPYENTIEPKLVSKDNVENYRISVRNNSVDFVSKLAENVSADTIVFYTSDHGQELHGRGTHCNTGDSISPREYTVPLIVLTGNKALQDKLASDRSKFDNQLTHIDFSESVRNVLGEKVLGANSIFNYKKLNHAYCGLYGQPLKFFGTSPSCKTFN